MFSGEHISTSLAPNTTLTHLNLSHNNQSSQIAASNAIANILKNNKTIVTLNLSHMYLGHEGLGKILTSLLQYKVLRDLNIAASGLNASSMQQLAELLSSEEVAIKRLNSDVVYQS